MLLTDLNGPMSVQPRRLGLRKTSRSRSFAAPAILILTFATFGATTSRAQDQQGQQDQSVAEAARQEKARKQEQQKKSKHVYTEEDLKHARILTPEDRAQIEAKRRECVQKNSCVPGAPQNSPATLDANSQPQAPKSLGEIARELRQQKELEALKPKQSEPFHLPFETPTLASPILPEHSAIRPPVPPVLRSPVPPALHPKTPANVFRRDPFSSTPVPEVRRPEISRPPVTRPEIRHDFKKEIHPETPSRQTLLAPAAPKISARPATPGTLIEPAAPVRPAVRPDFTKEIRPTVPSRRRTIAPATPKIPAHPAMLNTPIDSPAPSAPIPPTVRPDFGKTVRPALRAHNQLIAPVTPKISARPPDPSVLVRPAQPKPPVPATTVVAPSTVTVQNGDSLWKLAQHTLGHGNRWPELLALNPSIANPNQIHVGTTLTLPAVAATATKSRNEHNALASTITVHTGDTLWSLAKTNLGRSSSWPCLASANPAVTDPNRIFADQELVIPATCKP